MVLKSCPQLPTGLGSPQHGPLLASSPVPQRQLRADSGPYRARGQGWCRGAGHHGLSHQHLLAITVWVLSLPFLATHSVFCSLPELPLLALGLDLI